VRASFFKHADTTIRLGRVYKSTIPYIRRLIIMYMKNWSRGNPPVCVYTICPGGPTHQRHKVAACCIIIIIIVVVILSSICQNERGMWLCDKRRWRFGRSSDQSILNVPSTYVMLYNIIYRSKVETLFRPRSTITRIINLEYNKNQPWRSRVDTRRYTDSKLKLKKKNRLFVDQN